MAAVAVSEWNALAERSPDERAVLSPDGALTVGELTEAVLELGHELGEHGVRPGDRVVVALPNSVACVVAQLAVRVCGAVLVNLPAQLRRELVEIVEQTDARLIVLENDAVDDDALVSLGDRLVVAPHPSREGRRAKPASRHSDDVAWLAFTSGTTGSAKGAVHTEESLDLMVQAMIERYRLGADDVIVVAAPLGHAIGFVYGLQLALRARCPMAIVPRWDVGVAAQLVEASRGTFVAAPTPFLVDVVEAAESGSTAFASLRHFLCGGAPVPAAVLTRAERTLGADVASAYYGTSEAGAVTTCPPGSTRAKVLATVGKPLPGVEIRIVEGEIHVRGAQVCRRYWGGDDEGSIHADGWYATGDLGEVDGDGFLSITGRSKDLIIRGGVNISPLEVEETLIDAPNVRDVAVVGVADPRLGQRIGVAVVSGEQQPTLDELRTHCEARALAKVKWPERLVIVDRLPRTPTGKIVRRELSDRLEWPA